MLTFEDEKLSKVWEHVKKNLKTFQNDDVAMDDKGNLVVPNGVELIKQVHGSIVGLSNERSAIKEELETVKKKMDDDKANGFVITPETKENYKRLLSLEESGKLVSIGQDKDAVPLVEHKTKLENQQRDYDEKVRNMLQTHKDELSKRDSKIIRDAISARIRGDLIRAGCRDDEESDAINQAEVILTPHYRGELVHQNGSIDQVNIGIFEKDGTPKRSDWHEPMNSFDFIKDFLGGKGKHFAKTEEQRGPGVTNNHFNSQSVTQVMRDKQRFEELGKLALTTGLDTKQQTEYATLERTIQVAARSSR